MLLTCFSTMAAYTLLSLFFAFTVAYTHAKPANFTALSDKTTLLSFKNSVSADPFGRLSSWEKSTNHCLWEGVVCDTGSGRVVGLRISGIRSRPGQPRRDMDSGKLPESISGLTELRTLCLRDNEFSGVIPRSIGKLKFLEVLELQGNNFSGDIPRELCCLKSLKLLNLSFNYLSGSLPSGLIGNGVLRVMDLSSNMISGRISVVGGFGKCEFLVHLKLSRNYFVNEIPGELGKCRNLRSLLLDGNILEGRIPAEIGRISELRVLDISRNSLTDRIPRELGNCGKLSVVVLTNPVDVGFERESLLHGVRGEFNAFVGGIPDELLMLPRLQVLWAPRANLGGRLPDSWSSSCFLRVLNLGRNYLTGEIPESLRMCRNLTYLDLSLNTLNGKLPLHLQVPCMVYFNISRNNVSGVIPSFGKRRCGYWSVSFGEDPNSLALEDIPVAYSNLPPWGSEMGILSAPMANETLAIVHDYSSNRFFGSLPLFPVRHGHKKFSYRLLLNNNQFTGYFPLKLVKGCNNLLRFSVNLSVNRISGGVYEGLILDCLRLTELQAAYNLISGPIGPAIGSLRMLKFLDLTGNKLNGSLPDQLGKLKTLRHLLLGGNNLTGVIPSQLGQVTSLLALNLSHNALRGSIPASLANDSGLKIMLLDHNQLSGEIPSSFCMLSDLIMLDLSFNNLSGYIPEFQRINNCEPFRGNRYLQLCRNSMSGPPSRLPVPLDVNKWRNQKNWKYFKIAVVSSVSVLLSALLVIVVIAFVKRKTKRRTTLRRTVFVTFGNVPAALNYDNVVRATGDFSIQNRIGTGGFGSTYIAELAPGYLVAIKRLWLGKVQGVQQFEAEIRTLGRIRHQNLVTLMGYSIGEKDMFLIYNYLSGGNLDTFIHGRSGKNVEWPVIHKIATDIAQALNYLHYSCTPRIVHRDIKPSNILLDEDLNAYLSDFGLARLLEVSETHATTDVLGTFGYVAPEYATTCRVSKKADVYSFGVVLLELLSGKKSMDPSFSEYENGFNIVEWAKWLIREDRFSELFRQELWESGPQEHLLGMLRIASDCTVQSLTIRPSVREVLEQLSELNLGS